MTTLKEILDAAQTLSSVERAQLIEALWDSMSPNDWPGPSRSWREEIKRRSEAIDQGQMTASPWSNVRDRARDRAGLDE